MAKDDHDEFRWFEVDVSSFSVYAESKQDAIALVAKIDALGTPGFHTGQQKPCIELAVMHIKEAE
jgi:hypothetical protein